MSEEITQLTQEVESQDVVDETSATPETETVTDDTTVEVVVNKVENESTEDIEITSESQPSDENEGNNLPKLMDYLDSSLLDIKEVTVEDLSQYEEDKIITDDHDEEYTDTFAEIREKEVVNGTVVGFTDREVLIDIGFKSEGIIYKSEFEELPEAGEAMEVFIHSFEDRRGNILLSKQKADFQRRWTELRNSYENDEIITGVISRRIKGGMVVDLVVVQAFLPGSQIDIKPVTDFDEYIGVESDFKIVKFNELRQNIVLSRKVILADDLFEKRQEVLSQMEVGMVLEGIVKNITDFGAFIDLGGIDGLLHITDVTWGRINHPSERLKIGETITVKVIDFDVEKVRVSLGMKQLQPEPWQDIQEKYPVDTVLNGKIVNMMNYGAFIELEEGVEGLIHISEMSWIRHIKHPSDMFKVGDEVEAKILSIDPEEKKISLGIKQLQENPWDTIESKYPVGSDHEGIVRNLAQFGAFVELEEGIDGLVHISDMSWTKIVRHPNEIVKKSDKVKVRVLEVSTEDHRLALGIKQLEENPWESIRSNFSAGKVVEGKILKVLDKGIIFDLGGDLEGIVPMKRVPKNDKMRIKSEFQEGDSNQVTVQEVDEEYKKIILMMDFGFEPSKPEVEEPVAISDSAPEKLEIPKEVIDHVAGNEAEEPTEGENSPEVSEETETDPEGEEEIDKD